MKFRIILDAVLTALFAGVLVRGLDLAENGSIMPLLVGGLGSVLSIWQLGVDLFRFDDNNSTSLNRDNCRQLAWYALLLLLVITFGFLPSAPIWMFIYLRRAQDERWTTSLGLAMAMYVLLWLGFEVGAGVSLFNGVLRM